MFNVLLFACPDADGLPGEKRSDALETSNTKENVLGTNFPGLRAV